MLYRALDLSHCPRITNKVLYLLSKYKVEVEEDTLAEEDLWEPWPHAAAAGAGAGTSEPALAVAGGPQGSSSSRDQRRQGEAAGLGSAVLGYRYQEAWDAALEQQEEQVEEDARDEGEQDAGEGLDGEGEVGMDMGMEGEGAGEGGESAGVEQRNPAIHRPVKAGMNAAVTRAMGSWGIQEAAAPAAVTAAEGGDASTQMVVSSTSSGGGSTTGGRSSFGGVVSSGVGVVGRGLRSLVLCGNQQFLDDGVVALLQGPATKGSLQQLDISGCSKLSNLALQLPATVGGGVSGEACCCVILITSYPLGC